MTDWLMVIDLQPAFSHPSSPWFTPALAGVRPQIAALVERFGDRTLFTRFVPPATRSAAGCPITEAGPFALAPESERLWQLDPPWRGRPSVASHTFSKWTPEAIAQLGPDPAVVLCGVSTDCCVLMTALAAVDGGAHVRVVADACAAKSDSIHAAALALMATRAPQLTLTTTADECGLA